ncbi:hypothetical protein PV336_15860 [Streptomyces sp. MI02-2A]|uniref:hypothetical protein n=1 Tax=Streptomyces sp. MI02-2A TaxID=3028688 RepID=UPI0029A15E9D|nr:hypothetical protein [Streptomyces sp. MI02-2A]MDX3260695.1 hypothetical protein [Streptomyces sp. MI02-2A]
MPWLINEDRAVKAKLQGLTVSDVNAPTGGRPVPVRYRVPESELAAQTFPLIVIEHAGVEKADDREHRGTIMLPYAPEGSAPWWQPTDSGWDVRDSPYMVDFPIPYDIRYRVLVFTRLSEHDIALASAMAQFNRIPARFGFLEIPEDHTTRRLDLLGGPELVDTRDGDGKRMFRREYLISVSSEMTQAAVQGYIAAQTVALDLEYFSEHEIAT